MTGPHRPKAVHLSVPLAEPCELHIVLTYPTPEETVAAAFAVKQLLESDQVTVDLGGVGHA